LSPSTETQFRNPTEEDDRSSAVDPLADIEVGWLTWCRAGMYANPLMAFANAMLASYLMSRLRRDLRRG
jgi:hypothetical protein